MPRNGNGKPKTPNQVGAPTARYSNRTDLAAQNAAGPPAPPTQPIRVPTGGAYGSAQALEQSQKLAPLPQPVDTPQLMPGTTTPVAAQTYTPPNFALGGTPSARPNEPLTSGMAMGAGAGPNPAAQRQFSAGALLAALAAATGDRDLADMAELADTQGF